MRVFFLILIFHLSICFLSIAKITPQLEKYFSKISAQEEITAIVWLKEDPYLIHSNQIGFRIQSDEQRRLKSKKSINTKKENIFRTTSTLKELSLKTQKSLIALLENAQTEGEITDYKSFWLINAIAITAPSSFFENIKNRTDIKKIDVNWRYKLPDTPRTQPPDKQLDSDINKKSFQTAAIQSNLSQINIDDVWDNYRTNYNQLQGTDIKIAVLDTGIDYNHTLLQGKISYQYDFADNDSDAFDETSGHGTHVTGIIAAGNGFGIAPEAKLLIGKVFKEENGEQVGEMTWLINASEWAAERGAQIVNLSLGSDAPSVDEDMENLVNNLYQLGIITVAAIGNLNDQFAEPNTTSPGNCPNAIGVGAVDNNNNIASFSSRGPAVWNGTTYVKPNICAPGVSIYSTIPSSLGNYGYMQGTSQAAPHITGIIALMLQANPQLTQTEILDILVDTADDLGSEGIDNTYGAGIVDAYDAILLTDKELPSIEHDPIFQVTANNNITISINITDNVFLLTGDSILATLNYSYGNNVWQSTKLSTQTGDTFYSDIAIMEDQDNLYYYFSIRDLNVNNTVILPELGVYQITIKSTNPSTSSVQEDLQVLGPTPANNKPLSYPNPFNPMVSDAKIAFRVNKESDVKCTIFDIASKEIASIGNNITRENLYYEITWDGKDDSGKKVPNGLYFYVLKVSAQDGNETKYVKGKIAVLR